ncbi:Carcinine transporter [Blattella germanica]|nr:Carcinine transporter [Blattella germanica]
MDLDAILPDVGEFGAYQQLLLWFVLLPGVLPCGFHAYNQLFMAARPEHWCRVPELEVVANFSVDLAKNIRSGSKKNIYEHVITYPTCDLTTPKFVRTGML